MSNIYKPRVNVSHFSLLFGETVFLRDFVSFSDQDHDGQFYHVRIRDNSNGGTGFRLGNANSNLAANTWHSITYNQFANELKMVGGAGMANDSFQIQVFDGKHWSDISSFAVQTIAANSNNPFITGITPIDRPIFETVDVSQHFAVQDADGSTARRYRFRDSMVGGGAFWLNGVRQAENSVFEINAGQLGQLEYYTGDDASSESIFVSAYDGRFWSDFGQIQVTNRDNGSAPTVTPTPALVRLEQRVELGRLMQFNDADGNTMKKFRVRDLSHAAPSGYLRMDDTALAASVWHEFDARDLFRVSFVGATQSWNDTLQFQVYDGGLWSSMASYSQLTVNNRYAPEVTVMDFETNERAFRDLEELFVFSDQDGDPLRQLRVRSYGTADFHGRLFRGGVAMAGNVWHEVSRSELGLWEFQAGRVGVTTQVGIQASDGFSFTPNNVLNFKSVSSTPVVTGIDRTIIPQATIALGSMFSYSDAENHPMVTVRVKDMNTFGGSGSLYRNGQIQQAGVWHEFAGSQLNTWTFRSNENRRRDRVQIEVYDGYAWSNVGESWVTAFSNPPVVTTDGMITVDPGTVFQLADLFDYSDIDGHAMQKLRVTEGNADLSSGFLSKNGVRQDTFLWYEIDASDLSMWTYTAHSLIGGDRVRFSANDGYVWSSIVTLDINTATTPPEVTPLDRTVLPVTTIALSSLFSYFDADGDAMASIRVRDENAVGNSGFLTRDGQTMAAGVQYTIAAPDLSRWAFVSGDFLGFDELTFTVNDGYTWSTVAAGRVTSDTQTPTVTTFDYTLLPETAIAITDLFSYSDPDGLPIRWVRVRDGNTALNSGFLSFDGASQSAGTWFQIDVADFDRWEFVAGTHLSSDAISIEVSNGYKWSTAGTSVVDAFSSTPTVEVFDRAVNHNDQIRLSLLFDYMDIDGDPLAKIRIIDRNDNVNTGFLSRNGNAAQAKVWHEIAASDLHNWVFDGGVYLSQDAYSIQVSDGYTWSDIANATVYWRNLYYPKLSKTTRPAQQESALSNDFAIDYLFDFNQGDNFQIMGSNLHFDGEVLDPDRVYTFTRAQFQQVKVVSTSANNTIPQLEMADVKIRVQIDNVWSQWSSVNVLNAPHLDDALDTADGEDEFWRDPDDNPVNVVEYAFVSQLAFYYGPDTVERQHGHGFMAPNLKTQNAIREILDVYSSMINLAFVEVPETVDFDLSFGWMDMTDYPESQYAYTFNHAWVVHDPGTPNDHTLDGDMWFNRVFSGAGTLSLTDPDQGEWGYTTYIREIGRALGLEYTTGGAVVLDEAPFLSPDYLGISQSYNSVLSREDDYIPNPITPMLYDIAELQSRYGANNTFASGDDLYLFDDTQPRVRLVWDAGGIDTFSFENANLTSGDGMHALIDLRPGTDSYIWNPALDHTSRNFYQFGRWTIALGTNIERAIGSDGDDIIRGNSNNNQLFGGLGNDRLIGGAGDDELDGGFGDDTYIIEFGHQGIVPFGHRSASLFEDNGGGHDVVDVYETSDFFEIMGRDVIFDRDFAFHRDEQNLYIELTLDNNAAENTIRLRRMDLVDSQIETLRFGTTDVDLVDLFNQLAPDTDWSRFQLTANSTANGLLVTPL